MRLTMRFNSIVVGAAFFLASPLAATAAEIVGSDLAKLIGGASLKCTSAGKQLEFIFSQAKTNRSISFKGNWAGRRIKPSYKIGKNGRCRSAGKMRRFYLNDELPDAVA